LEDRRGRVAELRGAGESLRSTARILGCSRTTIHLDEVALERAGEWERPQFAVGADGRSRPARRERP
jgi:hypothetical protein